MPESALRWVKASSSDHSGACVELAVDGDLIAVRDSKHPEVMIRYSRGVFSDFLQAVKRGEFDDITGLDPA